MSVPCLLTKSHATCTETGCAYSMKYLSSIQVKQKIILILFTFNMLPFFLRITAKRLSLQKFLIQSQK